jgi:hypothetical protein
MPVVAGSPGDERGRDSRDAARQAASEPISNGIQWLFRRNSVVSTESRFATVGSDKYIQLFQRLIRGSRLAQ